MDFVDVVIREFKKKKKKNPKFSLRSFALKLAVDPSVLSKLLSRKRSLSIDLARLIAAKLELTAADRALLPGEILADEHPIEEYCSENILSPLVVEYLRIYRDHAPLTLSRFFDIPEAQIKSCLEYLIEKQILSQRGQSFEIIKEGMFFNSSHEIEKARKFYTNFYFDRWRNAINQGQVVQNLTLLIPFDEGSNQIMKDEMAKMARRLNGIFSDYSGSKKLYSVMFGAFSLEASAAGSTHVKSRLDETKKADLESAL